MCSISRDPRCEEYTICTAVAPDAVFTVRTYGTRQLYDSALVRKFGSREPRTRRSQRRVSPEPTIMSQLRTARTAASPGEKSPSGCPSTTCRPRPIYHQRDSTEAHLTIVSAPDRVLGAELRPRPFPDKTASLLLGLLAATRTGLPRARDDELTNTKIHRGITPRCHLKLCWHMNIEAN